MRYFDYYEHEWWWAYAHTAALELSYPLDLRNTPNAMWEDELEVFADYCEDRGETFKSLYEKRINESFTQKH